MAPMTAATRRLRTSVKPRVPRAAMPVTTGSTGRWTWSAPVAQKTPPMTAAARNHRATSQPAARTSSSGPLVRAARAAAVAAAVARAPSPAPPGLEGGGPGVADAPPNGIQAAPEPVSAAGAQGR